MVKLLKIIHYKRKLDQVIIYIQKINNFEK